MVTSTMSMDDALGQLRPLMTDDFIRAWRKVTLALGYRQVGKAVASLAAKSKPTTAQAPSKAYTLTEADQEYITSLESQLVEAETFFQDYPLLRNSPLKVNSRWRPAPNAFHPHKTRQEIEQLAVSAEMAQTLRMRGKHVDFDKRTNTNWLDSELIDEAYGKDVNLEEIYGARAGTEGHTFDDLLGLYRKAASYNVTGIQGEIARVLVEGC